MKKIIAVLIFLFLFGASIVDAQEKIKPLKGEGVMALLRRYGYLNNEITPEECLKDRVYIEFMRLNKGKFGKNSSLLLGKTYILPTKKADTLLQTQEKNIGKKMKEPLFGKKYEEYEIIDKSLEGAVFFLSSGHGGPDPGAIGEWSDKKIHEDEYAYDITLRLMRNLLQHSAKVYMIIQDAKDGIRDKEYLEGSDRETCMGKKIPTNKKKNREYNRYIRLKQRSDKIDELAVQEKSKYKRGVYIHLDSRTEGERIDVFFYHSGSKAGKQLARTMRSTFAEKYKQHQPERKYTGTISYRNLHMLRETNPPGVYLEAANIQNAFDLKRIVPPNQRQALANWMLEALRNDYLNNLQ